MVNGIVANFQAAWNMKRQDSLAHFSKAQAAWKFIQNQILQKNPIVQQQIAL